jgi:hypothetical protein
VPLAVSFCFVLRADANSVRWRALCAPRARLPGPPEDQVAISSTQQPKLTYRQLTGALSFQSLCLFSHKVEVVVVVYLHSVEGDGWPPPDRISYYLLGGVCVGSRLGWTWAWLIATKYWLAPIRPLRVPSLLKPAVEKCNSKLLSFPW